MRKSTVAIVGLTVALVASNAFWLYTSIDAGISHTYLDDSYRHARDSAQQALALLPLAARADSTKDSLVDAVLRIDHKTPPFEKDGFTWVGSLGLRFSSEGRLLEARADVDPP
jgi:hypothetical protein